MKIGYKLMAGLFGILMPWFSHAAPVDTVAEQPSWVLHYHDNIPADSFKSYDVIVLDSQYHPSLNSLLYQNKKLLGYLSLSEVGKEKPYFKRLSDEKFLMGTNPNWGGSIIDIRKPEWTKIVIEELIPGLLHQGFNGVMLDTADSAIGLEQKDPKTYAGMQQATVDLIKAIRYHYPNLVIMLNRGFEILPQVERDIDMLLAESIYVRYDFKNKTHSRVKESYYQSIADSFKAAKQRAPNLQIYTLDYWDMTDSEGVKAIYAAQRANGFNPYVSSIDLQQLYAEPK